MTKYKKAKMMGIAALAVQWIVWMIIPLLLIYYFLYDIPTVFWVTSISYPVAFWIMKGIISSSKLKIYLFNIPKTVVTDYGYTYTHFGVDCLMDYDSTYPYNLYLFSNKLFYWRIEGKKEYLESNVKYDIDYIKKRINLEHEKILTEAPITSYKKWDGIATEKKEILKNVVTDRVLEEELKKLEHE